MAKDGTMRGGRRQRSGPLPDSLVDKLQKGKPAKVMRFGLEDLQGGDNLEDLGVPRARVYARQVRARVCVTRLSEVSHLSQVSQLSLWR